MRKLFEHVILKLKKYMLSLFWGDGPPHHPTQSGIPPQKIVVGGRDASPPFPACYAHAFVQKNMFGFGHLYRTRALANDSFIFN